MTRAARPEFLAALAVALLAGCATGSDGSQDRSFGLTDDERAREELLRADPSKVIAAELAFARAAQEDGQWTAFIDYADDDAVMFVPQLVNAHAWLRQQTNPAQAVRWQPHQVWSSCDGSLAVTKGAWQRPNGTVGYFTTVWERKRDNEYEWVLDQGDTLDQALAAPELIESKVAECARPDAPGDRRERFRFVSATIRPGVCEGGTCRGGGTSADGTLSYTYEVNGQGRQLIARMRESGAMLEVLRSEVSAD